MTKTFPDWVRGGTWLAAAFIAALLLVKPIGVSTQYVIADGIAWSLFDDGLVTATEDGYTSSNAYLAKSGGKYAKAIANPLSYGLLFVLAIPFGAFLSRRLLPTTARNADEQSSCLPQSAMDAGFDTSRRAMMVFAGGFLTLFGARLAGGCTSGHMMSGISQTSISGYLFAAGVFATAVPLSMWLYRRRGVTQASPGNALKGGAA